MVALLVLPGTAGASVGGPGALVVGPVTDVSRCPGQNAEAWEAADPSTGDLYVAWMGCGDQIGLARSTDGGATYATPSVLADSKGAWDPSVAVSPTGTVYVAFMRNTDDHTFPVVEASFDHGATFPQVTQLVGPKPRNYGDRDFIAVGGNGNVDVTWTYGPDNHSVHEVCPTSFSCYKDSGDVNAVVQVSTDGGRTFGAIVPVTPGYPDSGGIDPPVVVSPDGQVDVEVPVYRYVNRRTLKLGPGLSFFSASTDEGATWSSPVEIGPPSLTVPVNEWWIDGNIRVDAGGDLYITFDTRVDGQDVGWLSYSTDGGATWSPLIRVTPDRSDAVHIVQVAGGPPGVAYVGWLADNAPDGWALYLRPYSVTSGWLAPPVQVSPGFGKKKVWPGDTFGIAALDPTDVAVSWGSAVSRGRHPLDEIFSAVVACPSC